MGSMQSDPMLLPAPSPTAGNQRGGGQRWPAMPPDGEQAVSGLVTVAQREEPVLIDPGGRKDLGVPGQPTLIEEPGGGRHGDAGGRLSEERQLQILADRSPAAHSTEIGGVMPKPAELGRPVAGWRWHPVRAWTRSSSRGRGAGARGSPRRTRVGPGEDGRDRLTGNVETEEAVPEGRHADAKDRARGDEPGRRQDTSPRPRGDDERRARRHHRRWSSPGTPPDERPLPPDAPRCRRERRGPRTYRCRGSRSSDHPPGSLAPRQARPRHRPCGKMATLSRACGVRFGVPI